MNSLRENMALVVREAASGLEATFNDAEDDLKAEATEQAKLIREAAARVAGGELSPRNGELVLRAAGETMAALVSTAGMDAKGKVRSSMLSILDTAITVLTKTAIAGL